MLKRIDSLEEQPTGYSYANQNGVIEYVTVGTELRTVSIHASGGQNVDIWRQDIPHLIKALQAAYNHKEA